MNLRFLRNIFIKNLALFLILFFGFNTFATLVNITSIKVYQSSSTMFVSTPAASLDISTLLVGSSFSASRVKSYAEIVTSSITLKPVIEKLGLSESPGELARNIQVTAPIDTVLLVVSVKDLNPSRASAIANSIARQFAITVSNLEISPETGISQVKVTQVKEAVPNFRPVSPRKKVNYSIAIIFAFGLTFIIGFLRELFDSTVKNSEDVSRELLGVIDFDTSASEKPLLSEENSYASRTEAMRQIRTNLVEKAEKTNLKVLNVTSSIAGEGKSTFCINLCQSLFQAGYKVCLVEGDLRRPTISKYLSSNAPILDFKIGLSDLLQQKPSRVSRASVNRHVVYLDSLGFYVITAGATPTNPAELLLGDSFSEVIKILRRDYDFVIIDSPPTLPVTDSRIIDKQADGIILLAKAGVVKKRQLETTMLLHAQVGAVVVGVCINMAPTNDPTQEYGYRSSKQNYESSGALKYYYNYYGYGRTRELYGPIDIRQSEPLSLRNFFLNFKKRK